VNVMHRLVLAIINLHKILIYLTSPVSMQQRRPKFINRDGLEMGRVTQSSTMSPFHGAHTTSYLPTVTMSMTCTVSEL